MAGDKTPSYINREEPDATDHRKAFLSGWSERVMAAKKAHDKAFRRMDRCMAIADGYQWTEEYSEHDDPYIANIVQRHVHQRASALYARNPTVVAHRRKRRLYKLWSGDEREILMAQQTLMMAQQQGAVSPFALMDPMVAQQVAQAQALLTDYQEGQMYERQIDGIAETLEILSSYFQEEQFPRFKQQMKQVVRRALITGAAYAKLNFQRINGEIVDPNADAQLQDARTRLSRLQQLIADAADEEMDGVDKEREELEQIIADLEAAREHAIIREGPVWSFPRTQNLIIDPNCRELVDFVGAGWVAEEYLLTIDQVKQIYSVDLDAAGKDAYRRYSSTGEREEGRRMSAFEPGDANAKRDALACVWEVWDKQSGLVFTIADGYCDFLREPKEPHVRLEQFFPYFTLALNQLESTEELFPQSDVWLLRHPQREYNRSKEAYRQHRWANRPLYVAAQGWADDEDMDSMSGQPAHAIQTLKNLGPGQKVTDLVQPMPKIGIDPNLYETGTVFDDVQRVVGTQEANLGGTSNATATETSIAESSRMSSLGSQADDLDDMLTAMKRAEGQIMLLEISPETVTEIVGPGAIWPTLSAEDIAKEIALEVEAGSSGRPNQAAEIQAFTQLTPLLIQIPGIVPKKLADVGLKIMNSRFRVEDFIDEALPSIIAMNSASQPSTGDPATDPAQQAAQGQNNAPQPDQGGDRPVPGSPGQPPPSVVR